MSDLILTDTSVAMEEALPPGTDEHVGDAADHQRDDDDDDSDDYDLMSMETPLMISNPIVGKPRQQQQERPTTGFTWSANAIRDCLAISLQAHNNNNDNNSNAPIDEWTPPSQDEWKPQPVPLPEWAMPVQPQQHQS
ncbi:hypothetical protein MHU86_19822 [Fragilaria crotonensis]|nr:hypothetical protein MHU86_19822 [Fragilaria crotonensis]